MHAKTIGYALRCPDAVEGMIMVNASLSMERSSLEAIPKACELLDSANAPSLLIDIVGNS